MDIDSLRRASKLPVKYILIEGLGWVEIERFDVVAGHDLVEVTFRGDRGDRGCFPTSKIHGIRYGSGYTMEERQ